MLVLSGDMPVTDRQSTSFPVDFSVQFAKEPGRFTEVKLSGVVPSLMDSGYSMKSMHKALKPHHSRSFQKMPEKPIEALFPLCSTTHGRHISQIIGSNHVGMILIVFGERFGVFAHSRFSDLRAYSA